MTARVVVAVAQVPGAGSPDGRRTRAARRWVQSRIGRALACEAAAHLSGCRPEEFQVAGDGDTRPVLAVFPRSAGDIAIGITHSGAWVGAAAGHGLREIGIDVEEVSRGPIGGMARFMNWTHALPSPPGTEAPDADRFTHLWTLWEAAVKCDGADLFAGTTPAFESLLSGCIPGTARSWSAGGYWALSQRVAEQYWLTLVAHCGGASAPSVETLRMHAPLALSTLV